MDPEHTYDAPGVYTVSLTVTDSSPPPSNTDTETKVAYITVTEKQPERQPTVGEGDGNTSKVGCPISAATGELYFNSVDLALGGPYPPLSFERYYASRLTDATGFSGVLGTNWMHGFEVRIEIGAGTARVLYFRGKLVDFTKTAGTWTLVGPEPVPFQLIESANGYHLLDPALDLIATFDLSGKLLFLENRNHKYLRMTYSGDLLTQVSDGFGRSFTLSYSAGKLSRVQDQSGRAISFSHSGNDLTSFTDANHRRSELTDRLGDSTGLVYHEASGKPAGITDTLGNTTTVAYTEQNQGGLRFYVPTRIDNPDGSFTTMTHDSSGNMLTLTDEEGEVWSFTYNGAGQITSKTTPDEGTWTFVYNSDTTLDEVHDPAGNVTSFTYDDKKRVIRATHPDGTYVSAAYDGNDNLLTITDERGKLTSFTYDANDNLRSITDPLGHSEQRTYDGNDRLVGTTDAAGKVTTFAYDAAGRLSSLRDRAGNTTTLAYDRHGWLQSLTDPAGKSLVFSYDREGVVASITDPSANTWSYSSNALGRLVRAVTPTGRSYERTYDVMHRLASHNGPLSVPTSYFHDKRGFLSGWALPGGFSAAYSHDSLGGITRVVDPSGERWDRVLDLVGRISSETDPMGNQTSYAYDNRGRLDTVTFPEGSLQLTYDETGRVTRKHYSDGTELTYVYDDAGRLVAADDLVLSYDARNAVVGSNGLAIARDEAGRIASITVSDGKTITYAYDSRGLVERVSDWIGGETRLAYTDTRRLASISRPNGTTTTFTYDRDGLLVGLAEAGPGWTSALALTRNDVGLITSTIRDLPVVPDLEPGQESFAIEGGCQKADFQYDGLGRVTSDGRRSYLWDLASRQVSWSGSGEQATLAYDGFDMMVSARIGTAQRDHVWNYAFGIPSISVVRQDGQDLRYYVHLPDGRLLHSIEAVGGARHFYHFDETGSTTLLTGDSGTITDAYAYAPLGEHVEHLGSTENPFTYQGAHGVMDESGSGLYYVRARHYDGRAGHFLSRDRFRTVLPRQGNPYAFGLGNPLAFGDVTGRQARVHRSELGLPGDPMWHSGIAVDVWHNGQIVGVLSADYAPDDRDTSGLSAPGKLQVSYWPRQRLGSGRAPLSRNPSITRQFDRGQAADERLMRAILAAFGMSEREFIDKYLEGPRTYRHSRYGKDLERRWQTYHLTENNCCHFTDAMLDVYFDTNWYPGQLITGTGLMAELEGYLIRGYPLSDRGPSSAGTFGGGPTRPGGVPRDPLRPPFNIRYE